MAPKAPRVRMHGGEADRTDRLDHAFYHRLAQQLERAHKGRVAREAQEALADRLEKTDELLRREWRTAPAGPVAAATDGVWPPSPEFLLATVRGLLGDLKDAGTHDTRFALEAVDRTDSVLRRVRAGELSVQTLAAELRTTSAVIASALQQRSLLAMRAGTPISTEIEEPRIAELVAATEAVQAEHNEEGVQHQSYVLTKRLIGILSATARHLEVSADTLGRWLHRAQSDLEGPPADADGDTMELAAYGQRGIGLTGWLRGVLPDLPFGLDNEEEIVTRIAQALLDGEGRVPASLAAGYIEAVAWQALTAQEIAPGRSTASSRLLVSAIADKVAGLAAARKEQDLKILREHLEAHPMLSLEETRRSLSVERPHLTRSYLKRECTGALRANLTRTSDRGGDEPNLVVAAHLAYRMLAAPQGCTLAELVADFRRECPELDLCWPGFSAEDVRMLGQAYGFVPAWPGGVNTDPQMTLERLPQALIEKLSTYRKIPFDSALLHDMRNTRGAGGALVDTVFFSVEKPIADSVAYFRHLITDEGLSGNNASTADEARSGHMLVWKNEPRDRLIPKIIARCFGIEGICTDSEQELLQECRKVIEVAPDRTAAQGKILAVHLLGTRLWEVLDKKLEGHPHLPVIAVSHTTSDADEVRGSHSAFGRMALTLMADSPAKAKWERHMFATSFAGILGSLYQNPTSTVDQLRGREFLVVGHAGNIIGPATARSLDGLQCRYAACDLKYNDGRAAAEPGRAVFANPALWAAATPAPGVVINCTADHVLTLDALLCSDAELHYFNLGTGTKDRNLVAGLVAQGTGASESHYEGKIGTVENRRYVIELPALDLYRRVFGEEAPVDLDEWRRAQELVDRHGYGKARWLVERGLTLVGKSGCAAFGELDQALQRAEADWLRLDDTTHAMLQSVACSRRRSVVMMADGSVFNFATLYPNPTPYSDFISALKIASLQDARSRLRAGKLGPEVLTSVEVEYSETNAPQPVWRSGAHTT